MIALWIELRTCRMRIWGLVAAIASILVAVLSRDRWFNSLADASVWGFVPFLYVGAVIVVGAADTARHRRSTSVGGLIAVSARPAWQALVAHVAVVLLYGVLLPVLLPMVVVTGTAQFGAQYGDLTWIYLPLGALFALGSCVIGSCVGALIPSRLGATFVALAAGLAYSLMASPIPPSHYPWLTFNAERAGLLATGVIVLIAALVVLSPVGERMLRKSVVPVGGMLLAVGIVVASVSGSLPKTQMREAAPSDTTCTTSTEYRVCVWNSHGYYLQDLKSFVHRFALLNQRMGGPNDWVVVEPGISADGRMLGIRPLGFGGGLWMTAESFAFALVNALPNPSCDYSTLNQDQVAKVDVVNWSLAEVMTNFIYGDLRPDSVRSANKALQRQVGKIASRIAEKPPAEQVDWIANTWESITECSVLQTR